MLDFTGFPLPLNLLVFAVAAAAVWYAGSKLAVYANAIAEATGINYAVIGMILLGGITSLPEIAVTLSASVIGDPSLAVGSIFGSVTLQVVVIAVADAMLRGRALTFVTGSPTVMLQGTFCCILVALAIAGMTVGDVAVGPVGLWSSAVFAASILALWMIAHYRDNEAWKPVRSNEGGEDENRDDMPLKRAIILLIGVALIIIIAGFVLAKTGEALAEQTGLGSTFVGTVLVGLSTSLPEISTVVAAVRIKKYLMAFSDIFGTNIFDLALLFLADLAYAGPPVLNEMEPIAPLMAAAAIMVTLIYMVGLIERQDRHVARLGLDSWAVIGVYLGSVTLLFFAGGSSG